MTDQNGDDWEDDDWEEDGGYHPIFDDLFSDASAIQNVSKELRANYNFVLQAAWKNGGVLEYASQELRADPYFILEAIKGEEYTTVDGVTHFGGNINSPFHNL